MESNGGISVVIFILWVSRWGCLTIPSHQGCNLVLLFVMEKRRALSSTIQAVGGGVFVKLPLVGAGNHAYVRQDGSFVGLRSPVSLPRHCRSIHAIAAKERCQDEIMSG